MSLLVRFQSTGQGGEGWREDLEGQEENTQHKNKLTQPFNVKGTVTPRESPGLENQWMNCRVGLGTQSLGASPHSSLSI